jgi:hypothetical protein
VCKLLSQKRPLWLSYSSVADVYVKSLIPCHWQLLQRVNPNLGCVSSWLNIRNRLFVSFSLSRKSKFARKSSSQKNVGTIFLHQETPAWQRMKTPSPQWQEICSFPTRLQTLYYSAMHGFWPAEFSNGRIRDSH